MTGLKGRIALVSGGAQGVGLGIVRTLVAQGVRVAIADLRYDKAEALAKELAEFGAEAHPIGCDLSGDSDCAAAVKHAVEVFGGLDIIVNNAAPPNDRSLIGELAGTDWEAHAQVVLNAVTRLADLALPHLESSAAAAIVNVSSSTATTVADGQRTWSYHVSKAGLEQLTRYLACRLGVHGIRVNAVAPGLVDREVGRKLSDNAEMAKIIRATVPLGRAGVAHDIGQAVAFLCSDSASYITGQVLAIDGGLGLREVFGASLLASRAQ